MGLLTKLERRAGLKMADDFIPASFILDPGGLPRTAYSYRRDIKQGLDSNVVMSPVSWVMRNFTEAEPVVMSRTGDDWDVSDGHALTRLIEEPTPFYDDDTLFKATLISYLLDGNAYWLKLRNAIGKPVELWYLPHFLVEPRWPHDGSTYISHYDYTPEWGGAGRLELPIRDVVHLRYGLDPRNTRKGFSQLKTLLREVFTDEEAANFSASILRNMGVPGGLIAPKEALTQGDQKHAEEMKDFVESKFTGDRRGKWLVMGVPTTVEQFGFDPNQLMLGNLRDIAEERVCAALGVPAAVVGFGSGLQSTKVGRTMQELRRSAWENCVIPHQTTIAKQVTRQIMPDFQTQVGRFRFDFDRRHVAAVGAEERDVAERAVLLAGGGIITRSEARELVGFPPEPPTDDFVEPASAPSPSRNGGSPAPEDETEELMNRTRALLASIKEE